MTAVRAKITDVRLHRLRVAREVGVLEPAWDLGGGIPFRVGGGYITEIECDQGLTGIGPGFAPELLPRVRQVLMDGDPFDTEQHAAALRYYAFGLPYNGAACVDIALWDLVGKLSEQPLYKLWGGGKDKVPAYASMVILSTPEERADLARRLADEGWQAIKLRLHHATLEEDLRTMELVRGAVGDRMAIMVDANQAQSSGHWQPGHLWDARRALATAKGLDEMGCYWLEEPLPRFAFDDLSRINNAVGMPLAGGENNRNIFDFLKMIESNVYDVLQPEGMVMVGLTELRKIGALAELYGKKVVPHHGGRSLGTVAHLHLVASWPHSPYLEMLHDPPIGDYSVGFGIMENPPVVDSNGLVAVPQAPGLGVDLDRSLIEETVSA